MAISPRPKVELEETYNAAADYYDHPAVSFWDRYGRRTVGRLPLVSGMAVLDVCCGMGTSAIPAAERVLRFLCRITYHERWPLGVVRPWNPQTRLFALR